MTQTTSAQWRGGGSAGWVNASWPFATLRATADYLSLEIAMIGTYGFAREQIVSLEPYGRIPILFRGLRLVHTRDDCPRQLIFWCFGSPDRLIESIHRTGFREAGDPSVVRQASGMPWRWSAIATTVIVWNGLFLLDGPPYERGPGNTGRFALVALALAFFVSMSAPRSAVLQRFFLRPGHRVEEITPVLSLLRLVTGILLVVFVAMALFAKTPPNN